MRKVIITLVILFGTTLITISQITSNTIIKLDVESGKSFDKNTNTWRENNNKGYIIFNYKNDQVEIFVNDVKYIIHSPIIDQKREKGDKYFTLSSLGTNNAGERCLIEYSVSNDGVYMDKVSVYFANETSIYYIGNSSIN